MRMKILIACEESQAVTIEMRRLGHEAYSCDIQDCSGGHPEWHIKGDARELIKLKWDMIIAHPPCTYMSKAGARWMYPKGEIDQKRYALAMDAKDFFFRFLEADCPRIAVENPVPLKVVQLPDPTQIIQPYEFGHPYSKATCLWLKGLPALIPTNIVEKKGTYVPSNTGDHSRGAGGCVGIAHRAKERAKTFPGIAKAMAEQWAGQA